MSVPVLLSDQEEWEKFKSGFNKSYEPDEEAKRFGLFQENLKKIREHNEKFTRGETTFTMGINHFADSTTEEKSRSCGCLPPRQ